MTSRFHCPNCERRVYWCRYCKIQHCPTCAPHPSRKRKYRGKVAVIALGAGKGSRLIGLRQLRTLQGNSKGGRVTATRPNPGRFTSKTARAAALKAWSTRWRKVRGVRIGRPRKNAKPVNRISIRAQYANRIMSPVYYETGIFPHWRQRTETGSIRISERTALRRLGVLPRPRKHWQPTETQPIIRVTTGINVARTNARRKRS